MLGTLLIVFILAILAGKLVIAGLQIAIIVANIIHLFIKKALRQTCREIRMVIDGVKNLIITGLFNSYFALIAKIEQ